MSTRLAHIVLVLLLSLTSCKQNVIPTEKYSHYIGYLDPETTISDENFEVCGVGKIEATHHGLPKLAYKPNKGIFDKTIRSKYKNNTYPDSGYLIFRFIVNCQGETGRFEIIQTDLNLEETKLNSKMVDQLYELTANKSNWHGYQRDSEPINYYMYISYKIEHGEISEILP